MSAGVDPLLISSTNSSRRRDRCPRLDLVDANRRCRGGRRRRRCGGGGGRRSGCVGACQRRDPRGVVGDRHRSRRPAREPAECVERCERRAGLTARSHVTLGARLRLLRPVAPVEPMSPGRPGCSFRTGRPDRTGAPGAPVAPVGPVAPGQARRAVCSRRPALPRRAVCAGRSRRTRPAPSARPGRLPRSPAALGPAGRSAPTARWDQPPRSAPPARWAVYRPGVRRDPAARSGPRSPRVTRECAATAAAAA